MTEPTLPARVAASLAAWLGYGRLGQASQLVNNVKYLQCSDLSIGYQPQAPVQQSIDATFVAGKLYALLGENGSGKSCLLKTLAGLLPVLHGSLTLTTNERAAPMQLAAAEQRQLAIEKRAAWQGYLEQQPVVHWGIRVRQVVELAAFARQDWSREQAAEAIEQALLACDCMALADRSVLQISAGERQRVMLARVLAAKPKVIMVDEPTTGLDPRHQHAVMSLLREQAARGTLVICVMHDIALTRMYCDEAMLLEKVDAEEAQAGVSQAGVKRLPITNVPELGPVSDILTTERVRRVFGIAG